MPLAEAVEKPTLIGAIDDHLPLQYSPSGKVSEMLPVWPIIPSALAKSTGSGCSLDSGPSTG